jgi:Domain of unknown function (DUF6475)
MEERDRRRFAELMQALGTTLSGRELTKPMLLGYWIALRGRLSLPEFEVAVEKALGTCRQMPSPVELRQFGGEMSPAMRAATAWEALKEGLRECSNWHSLDFDDPAINATVRNLGGLARLCTCDAEELEKWFRRDFEKLYGAFSDHGVPANLGAHLPGQFEISNNAHGYAVDPPKKIKSGVVPTRVLGEIPFREDARRRLLSAVSPPAAEKKAK